MNRDWGVHFLWREVEMTVLLIGLLILLALFGVPLFLVIAGIAVVLAWSWMPHFNPASFFTDSFGKLASAPAFVSIPLFAFAGYLMSESDTSRRLVRLFKALFGWMPGGLPLQILIVCSFFTVFTGASGVTIIALGLLLYPVLVDSKYPEDFSLGMMTASGSVGLLFPPSLPIIIYGIIATPSVDTLVKAAVDHQLLPAGTELEQVFTIKALFLAGIIPGIVRLIFMFLYGVWVGFRSGAERQPFNLRELFVSFWEAKWEALLPFIILGLLFGGWVSISEVALISAVYIAVVELLIYRDIPLSKLADITAESLKLVGSIVVILMSALYLSNVLIYKEVPDKLFALLSPHLTNRWIFLLALNLFLIVVGCLLDIFSAIIVVVPLILPLAFKFGVHPVFLGIVFLANLELGYLTPPVGINLFIASMTFKESILRLYRVSLPFLGTLALSLLVITYVPGLSMWLPKVSSSIQITEIPRAPVSQSKDGEEGEQEEQPDQEFMKKLENLDTDAADQDYGDEEDEEDEGDEGESEGDEESSTDTGKSEEKKSSKSEEEKSSRKQRQQSGKNSANVKGR